MHCIAFLFCKLQSLTTHCNYLKFIDLLKHYGKRNN
jgi:hypothetical protein